MEIVFTDRYSALGIPLPDPATVCLGFCEGTGFIPVKQGKERNAEFKRLADAEHLKCEDAGECDGWHFITCPDCKGTGKRGPATAEIPAAAAAGRNTGNIEQ